FAASNRERHWEVGGRGVLPVGALPQRRRNLAVARSILPDDTGPGFSHTAGRDAGPRRRRRARRRPCHRSPRHPIYRTRWPVLGASARRRDPRSGIGEVTGGGSELHGIRLAGLVVAQSLRRIA